MKRIISIVLTLLLIVATGNPAWAAQASSAAATVRLERTEGSVTLADKNGAAISITQGMKVYNGYVVKTKAKSYAYLSLDSSKSVKLDASSAAEIRKLGKKLKVLLKSGKVFFNVKEPLKNDESLEVRTSTMVTGIRGTAGIAEAIDNETSALYLLDGQVSMSSTDASTGDMKTMEVKAGEAAFARSFKNSNGQSAVEVTVMPIKESDISGFAAVELAKDQNLQEKITQQTSLDIPRVVEQSQHTLTNDQKNAEESKAPVTDSTAVTKQPVSQNSSSGGSGGGSGHGSHLTPEGNGGSDDGDDEPGQVIALNNPSARQIKAALLINDVVTIRKMNKPLDEEVTIDANKRLDIISGTMVANRNAPIINYGNLNIASTGGLTVNTATGTAVNGLSNFGTLTNDGLLQVTGSMPQQGIVNLGQIINKRCIASDAQTIFNNDQGTLICAGGILKAKGIAMMTGGAITDVSGTAVTLQLAQQEHDFVGFTNLADLIALAEEDDVTITLLSDVTCDSDLRIPEDMKMTMLISNYVIDFSGHQWINEGDLSIVGIDAGELVGSVKNKGDLLLNNVTLRSDQSFVLDNSGELNIAFGSRIINEASGCAIVNRDSSEAVASLEGGTLQSQNGIPLIVEGAGRFTLKGGTIEALSNSAVRLHGDGFIVEGGQVISHSGSPSPAAIENEANSFLFKEGEIAVVMTNSTMLRSPCRDRNLIRYEAHEDEGKATKVNVLSETVNEGANQVQVSLIMNPVKVSEITAATFAQRCELHFAGLLTLSFALNDANACNVSVIKGIGDGSNAATLRFTGGATIGSEPMIKLTDESDQIGNITIINEGTGLLLETPGNLLGTFALKSKGTPVWTQGSSTSIAGALDAQGYHVYAQ